MTTIQIGSKTIGEGHPTYIIAEIGINHNADMGTAKQLIDVAAEAKVDAVKFQKRHLPSIYPEDVLENTVNYEFGFQYMIPILKKTELSEYAHIKLKHYAESKGLEYICTPFDLVSANFLSEIDVVAYKIASCDLTNEILLQYISKQNRPIILSTGMSTWEEIERTVKWMKGNDIAILHCRSSYPVWPREANLKMINRLKEFGVPVGYSGHDIGITIPLIAASMGANIVEKHITLDQKAEGPDHKISLLPAELKILVRDIRIADQAMQDSSRFLLRGEILNRDVFRYKGYPQAERKTLPTLDGEPPGRWGLISRIHDIDKAWAYEPEVIELHLTEDDLNLEWTPEKEYEAQLVVHVPEYILDKIGDLCSGSDEIRRASVEITQRTIDFARYVSDWFIGTPKVVVHPGAMSMNIKLKQKVMECNLKYSLREIKDKGVELLLENLPPYPWYLGGAWKGNFFMDADEIKEFCNETGNNICFDLSHAALYHNANPNKSLEICINRLTPYIRHMHIADAYGVDGEGVQIGTGDIDFNRILPLIDFDTTWVPETWQGHKDNFAGFIKDLNKIIKLVDK